MSDFPRLFSPALNRGILSPAGDTPLGDYMNDSGVGYSVTATTWTANRAVYQPIHVEFPCIVTQLAVRVQTQAGNLDGGIYTWDNKKIVSLGSTGVAAAGVQLLNIADTTLTPGWYRLAFGCDSGTAAFKGTAIAAGIMRACGVQEQTASAFALPDPLTPINYATAVAPLIVAAIKAGP